MELNLVGSLSYEARNINSFFISSLEPNPFANLWNSQANAVPQLNDHTFAFSPMSMPMNAMPPLAFPPMPPMIFTPPPTIPANLDQLTEEELRALEGNERQHVEERLKVSGKRCS